MATETRGGVGYLGVYRVTGYNAAREVTWRHDVVARTPEEAVEIAKEFVLTVVEDEDYSLGLRNFRAKRAKSLSSEYGLVIGERSPVRGE